MDSRTETHWSFLSFYNRHTHRCTGVSPSYYSTLWHPLLFRERIDSHSTCDLSCPASERHRSERVRIISISRVSLPVLKWFAFSCRVLGFNRYSHTQQDREKTDRRAHAMHTHRDPDPLLTCRFSVVWCSEISENATTTLMVHTQRDITLYPLSRTHTYTHWGSLHVRFQQVCKTRGRKEGVKKTRDLLTGITTHMHT